MILLVEILNLTDIVKLASILIRNSNDFSKSPILGAEKSMLELRQELETLHSSKMMPKSTSTQISSPGDIGKRVFQNSHFQTNCCHISWCWQASDPSRQIDRKILDYSSKSSSDS
jgi:hypothetical protein